MTHEDLIAQISAIKRALDSERVEIWIQVIESDGTLAERIFQGTYVPTRDPKSQGERS